MDMDWWRFFDLTTWAHSAVGFAHMVAGLIALILGPIVLLRRKGTSSHRVLGYVYVAIMLGVNLSALVMYDLTGGPNLFHVFAVVSLVSTGGGLICALGARSSPGALTGHYHFMSWSYFGLFAAFASQLMTRAVSLGFDAGVSPFFLIGVGTGIAALLTSIYINVRAKRVLARYGVP